MKPLTILICVGLLSLLTAGCTIDGPYIPELPTHARTLHMDYQSKPDHKVFVVAIDPNGDFAVGYEYGKATMKEAYDSALAKCNANRKVYGVFSPATIYSINGNVVYESAIRKAMAAE